MSRNVTDFSRCLHLHAQDCLTGGYPPHRKKSGRGLVCEMNIVTIAPSCYPSQADASDVELMTAVAKKRSQEAFAVLHGRYRFLLRSVIHRVLSTDADADDVLQKVLIQIWHNAGEFSSEKGNLLGWLITIARRRSLDHVRKQCAYRSATDRYEKQAEPWNPRSIEICTVDQQVSQNELKRQVQAVMHKLPEAQREAVGLTYFQGLSQREIATRLSVPLGTIKTRIELGMRKLGRSWLSERAA